jgi:hypothetical protein
MEMAVKSMETAVESMSRWRWLKGHFPVPAGCPNRDFYPPKLVFDSDGAAELFW